LGLGPDLFQYHHSRLGKSDADEMNSSCAVLLINWIKPRSLVKFSLISTFDFNDFRPEIRHMKFPGRSYWHADLFADQNAHFTLNQPQQEWCENLPNNSKMTMAFFKIETKL
jgi:hypothetical protein